MMRLALRRYVRCMSILLATALLTFGCGSTRSSRVVNGGLTFTYRDVGPAAVYAAAKKALTDDGLAIEIERPEELLIVAVLPGGRESQKLFAQSSHEVADDIELSVRLKSTQKDTLARVNIVTVHKQLLGSERGVELGDRQVYIALAKQIKDLLNSVDAQSSGRTTGDSR